MSVWTVLAALCWMLLGAAIALGAVILRGRRKWTRAEPCEYGALLGRRCMVRKGDGTWRECVVIAVSWKGAMCVRNTADGSGRHGKWIPKESVPERVRFA